VHRRTAAEVLDKAVDAVSPAERELGKLVNFATIYGQGAAALSVQIGSSRKVAQAYIDRYFRAFSGVAAWREAQVPKAIALGYVETLFGRRRYVDELSTQQWRDRSYGERVAVNTPITGTAADLCKLAMLNIDRALRGGGFAARLVLQIHDELLLEVPDAEIEPVRALVERCMSEVWPLDVPMAVHVGVGRTWSEAK
jgi:DNA polymerase-1